jgi:hypothetical protein
MSDLFRLMNRNIRGWQENKTATETQRHREVKNSKFKIRNSKQFQIPKTQNSKYKDLGNDQSFIVLNIRYSNFEFVSDFDIKISNFSFLSAPVAVKAWEQSWS